MQRCQLNHVWMGVSTISAASFDAPGTTENTYLLLKTAQIRNYRQLHLGSTWILPSQNEKSCIVNRKKFHHRSRTGKTGNHTILKRFDPPTPFRMIPKYRQDIAKVLSNNLFVTEGGTETTLIFDQGIDLPYFAAYTLLETSTGTETLREAYAIYARLAQSYHTNILLESPTWRASRVWGDKLGYSTEQLEQANRSSIELMERIRDEYEGSDTKIVVSACVGPKGDGYVVGETIMNAEEAEQYHSEQIKTLSTTNADLVSALTMTTPTGAIGIARAASKCNMPCVISFTVETDGKLPNGQSVQSAIEQVDVATNSYPLYYMINCAHPSHFQHIFDRKGGEQGWTKRIQGVRANASCKSHAELEESTELDAGNPTEIGEQTKSLHSKLPHLTVLGGCCGTDHRHIEAICKEIAQPKQ